jgi:hypothetical protein
MKIFDAKIASMRDMALTLVRRGPEVLTDTVMTVIMNPRSHHSQA